MMAGCSLREKLGEKIMEKTIESQTSANVDVDADKEQMTINNGEGKTQIAVKGGLKIPDNMPQDVFVIEDRQLILARDNNDGGFSLTYHTAKNLEDAGKLYDERMSQAQWALEMDMKMGEQGRNLIYKRDDWKVNVIIGVDTSKQGGQTVVTIVGTKDKKEQ